MTLKVSIKPKEYSHALRNPLKGFRPRNRNGKHEYGTLCRVYMKWNDLERNEKDGLDRIINTCNLAWNKVE
ncbi:hypothetical protein, partial [Moorena sp. SIO4A1]|uniref:hypothetical protein n=1 Tax=Moorena sp. SIO4A1 TaxID=2607835 RepID=UPI0025CC1090